MRILAVDIGSSSVKAAVLRSGRVVGNCARESFATHHADGRAEVAPSAILAAIVSAIRSLDVGDVEMLCLCAMAPSWLAMGRDGRALTPIITHQDRRSIEIARELEARIGRKRHLKLAGNRPFPGGISSTIAAWHVRHHPALMKRATLLGHLSTYLLRRWTGARVIDPGNASFTGFFETTRLGGWSDELMAASGVRPDQMPQVVDAAAMAGTLTPAAAAELSLPAGLPVLPGIMDTSAAMLLNGAAAGTLLNISGSTDVLALCTDKAHPHEQLLTRALGTGRKWLAVSTIASAGTTLSWLHQTLFSDWDQRRFFKLVGRQLDAAPSSVRFVPHLAGDRLSIEQKQGGFNGLTLGTTREQMLQAAINALAEQSAARLPLFEQVYGKLPRDVMVAGGVGESLAKVLHRDWPGTWRFRRENEATLRGLYALATQSVT